MNVQTSQPRPLLPGLRFVRGLLNSAQRRFRRARSGSVLILVVALLVLLALIGTAFITTAGNDRDASTQHKYNTQIAMLLQGVKDMAIQMVSSDIAAVNPETGRPSYRGATPMYPDPSRPELSPATFNQVPKHYSHVDYLAWDAMLADRWPSGVQPAGLNQPATAARWRYISASPLATNRDPARPNIFPNQFTSPLVTPVNPANYSSRFQVQVESISVTLPNGQVRKYPAFIILDDQDPNYQKTVMAADADGDGIADSGLFELPIGQIDGVRYYAAIRIVDNAGALNASVAWEHWRPENPAIDGRLQGNITPANVELRRLLEGPNYNDGPDPNRFQLFQNYRQGDQTYPGMTPVRDDGAAPHFQWATRFDAFYFGLGHRLDNPGYVVPGLKYRSLGVAESAAMAYRFTLANPMGSQSILEQYFPNATRMASVRRQPFSPDQSLQWFDTIFNVGYLTPNNRPIRPWVVAHNPVSNFVPAIVNDPAGPASTDPLPAGVPVGMDPQEIQRNGQYRYRGGFTAGQMYHIGEWVRSGNRSYVAIVNHLGNAAAAPGTLTGVPFWAEVPWEEHPVKLNPNTANFGSLMAAYHAVMFDGPLVKPAGTADAGYGGTAATLWTFGDVTRPAGGGAPLQPYYVKQLRAALAAVNTIDLRDQDDDITSRTILMTGMDGSNPIPAQVYGQEKQPFITESMVHITAQDVPYVIVELYNPHDVPVRLDAFRLAYRARDTGAITAIPVALTGQIIAPNGYLYIENDENRRPTTNGGTYTGLTILQEATLEQVVYGGGNRELMLLRTRRYDGTPTNSAHPANAFNEGSLEDLIPVDQLEYYGITPGLNRLTNPTDPTMLIPIAERFHYRRANMQPTANAWHAVYSGPYNRSPAAEERRQRGWVRDPRPAAATPTDETLLTAPGYGPKGAANNTQHNDYAGASNVSTYRTRVLQLNTAGMGGPWKGITGANSGAFQPPTPAYGTLPDGTSAPAFPFGGFARNGDILQVTFVGSYRLDQGGFREMNSVSIDASFAEDGDMTDDDFASGGGAVNALEQLGRFCPLFFGAFDDIGGARPSPLAPQPGHRYAWARDIFDYFNVLSPQDDYLPNIDPTLAADPTVSPATPKWPGGDTAVAHGPQPIPNAIGTTVATIAAGGGEDAAANHGLINLNTAHFYVVEQLPFTNDPTTNANLAKQIVTYRETVGPFRNLFDLLKVPGFAGAAATQMIDPQMADGDLTPYPTNLASIPTHGAVAGDFEAHYLMLNRISNLVTFRSDSFTAYIVVQGWRNAGSTLPELVAQRRAAVIIDRSRVVPMLKGGWMQDVPVDQPSLTNVPQN